MARRQTGIHCVETGQLIAGRFKVLNNIGEGGMGIVYRGWDMRADRQVAIKILHEEYEGRPDLVKRFRDEVAIINRIGNDGIATVLDCAQEGERPIYIVLEFLDGPTLHNVLGEPAVPLHPQRILKIGRQILDILADVHENNIIHRDLKPENVFILRRGPRHIDSVKIIDFGIAKFAVAESRLTQVGTVVGTPWYMSPEQCQGLPVDHRTDLYAVGVMFYEMTTGRLPFIGERDDVLRDHIYTLPERPSELNPDLFNQFPNLEAVILTSLRKRPDDRFQTAEEFADVLEAAIPEDKTYYRDSQHPSPVNGYSLPPLPPGKLNGATQKPTPLSVLSEPPAAPTNILPPNRRGTVDDIATAKTLMSDNAREVADPVVQKPESVLLGTMSSRLQAVRIHCKKATAWARANVPKSVWLVLLVGAVIGLTFVILVPLLSSPDKERQDVAMAIVPDAGTSQPDARGEVVLLVPTVPIAQDVTKQNIAEKTPARPPVADVSPPEPDATVVRVPTLIPAPATPTPPPGYAELLEAGRSAMTQGNLRLATRKFQEATQLWAEGPDAWRALGDALVRQGKRKEAANVYREYLRLRPHAPDRHYLEGLIKNW